MSNSKLVDVTIISPNSSARTAKIDTITIHHMACNLSVEVCGAGFQAKSRKASSNYGIDTDGRVGLYVDESRRAWTSSNRDNDNRAITIEVANDGGSPDWHVSDKALAKTIDLCVDICQRNGIKKLNYTGDTSGNLTMHKWFAATACPGPYLGGKFPYIAQEVNKRLSASGTANTVQSTTPNVLYRVQVGAFNKKANAENQLKKVKNAGFSDAFIVVVDDTLYRVQIGAYSIKANAEAQLAKVEKAGFTGFVTMLSGQTTMKILKVGSTVRVKKGAKDCTGASLASFVYERDHKVKSIDGNRVVITYNGAIVAAVHKDNLILV